MAHTIKILFHPTTGNRFTNSTSEVILKWYLLQLKDFSNFFFFFLCFDFKDVPKKPIGNFFYSVPKSKSP